MNYFTDLDKCGDIYFRISLNWSDNIRPPKQV